MIGRIINLCSEVTKEIVTPESHYICNMPYESLCTWFINGSLGAVRVIEITFRPP